MKKLLAIAVFCFAASSAHATNWFVARSVQGDGTCLTDNTHACVMTPTMKSKAVACGDHIKLANGNTDAGRGTTYDLSANMLDFLTSGTSWATNCTDGNEIVIEAESGAPDSGGFYVKMDSLDTKPNLFIWNQNHLIVRYIEFKGGKTASDYATCQMSGTTAAQNTKNQIVFSACHDSGISNNAPSIRLNKSISNKVADNIIFGTNRKGIEEIDSSSHDNIVARNIIIHDGSIVTSGVQGMDTNYNAVNSTALDNIVIVRGYLQPQSYNVMGNNPNGCQYIPSGNNGCKGSQPGASPYTCVVSGCATSTQYNNWQYPFGNSGGMYMIGHTAGAGQTLGKTMGNVTLDLGVHVSMKFGIYYGNYMHGDVEDNIFVGRGSTAQGGNLLTCNSPCTTPTGNVFTNNTFIMPVATTVGSGRMIDTRYWTVTNLHDVTSRTTEDFYTGSHASVGALECFLHNDDGTLSATVKWTAYDVMNTALQAALVQNGLPALNVKSEVFSALGQAPVGCGGPLPTPTPTNTATNTPTATATFTPSNTPTFTNTPTGTRTPTVTPTPTGTAIPTPNLTPQSPVCNEPHWDIIVDRYGKFIRWQLQKEGYGCNIHPPHTVHDNSKP